MKKLGVITSIAILLFLSPVAFAQDSISKEAVVTLDAKTVHPGDYFAAGETVILAGTVKGDAYIVGGQIIIDGTIDGDLLVAGGTITVNGTIGQDLRLAGGNILIGGKITQNATLIGGNIHLTKDAKIGGNITTGSGNLTIAAPLKGNLYGGSGNLTLSNQIDGFVKIAAGHISLLPQTLIKGNLTYTSDQAPILTGNATVSGQIIKIDMPITVPKPDKNWREVLEQRATEIKDTVTSAVFILGLINSLVLGFLIVYFFPNWSYRAILSIEESPWKTALIGLAGLILTPMLLVISLILIIGMSTSAVLTATYLSFLYLSRIIFGYWLGARFIQGLQRMAGPGVTLFVGLGLFYLLSTVTYFGSIITLISLIFGLGAILSASKDGYLSGRTHKSI
jgi:cytoskeletal protein CcmA (bactofilin family)